MFEAGRYLAQRFLDNADATTRSPGRLDRSRPSHCRYPVSIIPLVSEHLEEIHRGSGPLAALGLSFTERGWAFGEPVSRRPNLSKARGAALGVRPHQAKNYSPPPRGRAGPAARWAGWGVHRQIPVLLRLLRPGAGSREVY